MGSPVHPDDLFRDLFDNLDKYIDHNATTTVDPDTTRLLDSVTAAANNATSLCPDDNDRWWSPGYYQCLDPVKAVGLYFVCFVLIVLIIVGIVLLLLVCACFFCCNCGGGRSSPDKAGAFLCNPTLGMIATHNIFNTFKI